MASAKRTRTDILADHLKAQMRYLDIQTRGAEALTSYDRTIAYGGDDEKAVRESLRLVGNHIAYFRRELEELDKKPQQRSLL